MRDPSSSIELVFRFLDSRRYRGNLRRAAQQGLVLAPSAIVGLALQINKRLDATGRLAPRRLAPRQRVVPSNSTSVLRQSIFERPTLPPSSRTPSGTRQVEPFLGKCSDLGVPAPYGRNIAPMRVYHRRGCLIGESQERVARAKPLPGDVGVSPTTKNPLLLARRRGQVEDYARRGDEVEQLVDLASIGRKSPLDRRLRSRVATRPFQLMGMEERHTPKSELLRFWL